MNNFLLFIGAVLVLALGAAFAAPQYVDWDDYRGAFEEEASRVLGRPIRVGGKVDLRLLPTPYVRFERFRVADQDGHFGRPLFKADVLKMWVSVVPLFRGVIEAKQIQISRPRLRLVFDENGQGNWRGLGQSTAPTGEGLAAGLIPGKVALQNVIIKSGLLTIYGPGDRELFKLTSVDGALSAPSLSGPFQFKGDVRYGGRRRDIKIVSRRAAADGTVPFKAVIKDAKNGSRFMFDGAAQDLATSPRFEGDLTAKLPLALNAVRTARAGRGALASQGNGSSGQTGGQQSGGQALGGQALGVGGAIAKNTNAKAPIFDLRSKLKVTASGLKLSGLALSFVRAGRPQLLSGEITTNWQNEFSTAAQFSARWLDLDQIAGGNGKSGNVPVGKSSGSKGLSGNRQNNPLLVMAAFVGQLDWMLGNAVVSQARIKIDQANLGGDVVSNIVLDLSKANNILQIKGLRAEMPGRAIVNAQGRVTGPKRARIFEGDLLLRGANLKQYLSWVAKGRTFPGDAQGRFGINAHLQAGPGWLKVSSILGEIKNTSLFGSVDYDWRGKPLLALDLQVPQLDATRLRPDGLQITDLLRAFAGTARSVGAKPGAADERSAALKKEALALGGPAVLDKSIKWRIGKLITSRRTYYDVVGAASFKDDVYTISKLSLLGADNELSLDLSGTISNVSTAPKGVLRGWVKASNGDAVRDLAALLQIPVALTPGAGRSGHLAPLRLAGSLKIGKRQTGSLDLTVAGSANGAPVHGALRLDQGLGNWRDALIDASLEFASSDLAALTAQLMPQAKARAVFKGRSGRFALNTLGVPAKGLATVLALNGAGLEAAFDGTLKLSTAEQPLQWRSATGRVTLKTLSLAPLLSLAKLDGDLVGGATPAKGSFSLAVSPGKIELQDLSMVVAGSTVRGTASLHWPSGAAPGALAGSGTSAASSTTTALGAALGEQDFQALGEQDIQFGQRRRLTANLVTNSLTLAALLTPVLGARNDTITGASYAIAGGPTSLWPESSFSWTALRNLDGAITLTADQLTFGRDLKLADATLNVRLEQGRVVVKSFQAAALGGQLVGSLQLDAAPAGAVVKGAMKLTRGDLAVLLGGGAGDGDGGNSGAANQSAAYGALADGRRQRRATLAATNAQRGFANSGRTTAFNSSTSNGSNSGSSALTEGASVPPATGTGSFTLSFAGQAVSPRGLMSVLRGSGVATLGPARLRRLTPRAISAAADAVLDRKPKDRAGAMNTELLARLRGGDAALGPRIIKLTLGDGALRAHDIEIETAQGTIRGSNRLDLSALNIVSNWTVTAKPQRSSVTGRLLSALPPVSISYAGALGQLGALEPRLQAEALTRELTVREMERDVERLEQIRKSDEGRAQLDTQRRRALELIRERQRQQEEAGRYRGLQDQPLPGLSANDPDFPGGAISGANGAALNGAGSSRPGSLTPNDRQAASESTAAGEVEFGNGSTTPEASQSALSVPTPKPVVRNKRKRKYKRKPKPQSFWDLFN